MANFLTLQPLPPPAPRPLEFQVADHAGDCHLTARIVLTPINNSANPHFTVHVVADSWTGATVTGDVWHMHLHFKDQADNDVAYTQLDLPWSGHVVYMSKTGSDNLYHTDYSKDIGGFTQSSRYSSLASITELDFTGSSC
jgi:hypothetical protein